MDLSKFLSLAISTVFLVGPFGSLAIKNEGKQDRIEILKEESAYNQMRIDALRSEKDSLYKIVDAYREKLQLEVRELDSLQHIIYKRKNKVDTIVFTKTVIDSAALNKIKKQNDSLKNRLRFDSILLRKKEIGVRPMN